jgi:hypothetical protein
MRQRRQLESTPVIHPFQVTRQFCPESLNIDALAEAIRELLADRPQSDLLSGRPGATHVVEAPERT